MSEKDNTENIIDIRERNFAFVDLEMTGLDLVDHEILEIGLVLAHHVFDEKGNVTDIVTISEHEWKTKPLNMKTADPAALAVNKYKEEDWKEAIPLKEALTQFSDIVRNAIMVGHNVAYDNAFLSKAFSEERVQDTMHYHKLDTLSLAYATCFRDKNIKKFSLSELSQYLNIENKNAHSALSDARATFDLYKKLLKQF